MAAMNLSQMIARVKPSVVLVRNLLGGHGTGVIFKVEGPIGYVVTNHHVVKDEREVMLTVNDSSVYKGQVFGTDKVFDLAFVRFVGQNLSEISFGNSSTVNVGDDVVAIGYPFDYVTEATVTRGIISAITYDRQHRCDVFRSDVTINPGNSGGPMLSVNGEILGINTFMSNYDQGNAYGFAIPESAVRAFASRMSVEIPPARPRRPHQPRPAQQSQPAPRPESVPKTPPARQPQRAPQPSSGSTSFTTYLKIFGGGFLGIGFGGAAIASLVFGMKGDLSVVVVVSGLIGGSLATYVKWKFL